MLLQYGPNPSRAGTEYHFLLSKLLTNQDLHGKRFDQALSSSAIAPTEQSSTKRAARPLSITDKTKGHFEKIFSKIDGELVKLFNLEKEKTELGADGYMPQLSAGRSLGILVKIVSTMMSGQPVLTQIV